MAFNLTNFKGALAREGARPTLFEATISYLNNTGVLRDFVFQCKAAQLPGKTFGVIELPYFGRKIKVAGDQTFAEWTVTVINEENFPVRNAFERWTSLINTHAGNVRADVNYKNNSDAFVTQFSKDGRPVKTYQFKNIWPSDLAPIDVAWDANDTVEEFTVTLQYDWWESANILR